MGFKQRKEKKEVISVLVCMTCTPPDSEGVWRATGFFVLPGHYHDAAQVADSYSAAFIQDQKLRGFTVKQTT
jgi:hypothetical protein